MKNIFFSICIPATKREAHLVDALESTRIQKYRNFEVIVTSRSLESTEIIFNQFVETVDAVDKSKYKFFYIDEEWNDLSEWNDALYQASGDYVAMLEGDDCFEINYLQRANSIISNNSQINIYSTRNQNGFFPIIGNIKNKEFIKILLGYKFCPPPSQTIFKRCDNSGLSFLYDTQSLVYAPELELYIRLLLCISGDVYIDNLINVWRRDSPPKKIIKDDGYKFSDILYILNKYSYHITFTERIFSHLRIGKKILQLFVRKLIKNHVFDYSLIKIFLQNFSYLLLHYKYTSFFKF